VSIITPPSWRRDQVEVGELIPEELALAPAVGSVEPPGPTGAGNRDAVEGRVAGQLVPEAVKAEGPGALRVAPPVEGDRPHPSVVIQV